LKQEHGRTEKIMVTVAPNAVMVTGATKIVLQSTGGRIAHIAKAEGGLRKKI
jgi:hypothetical protein